MYLREYIPNIAEQMAASVPSNTSEGNPAVVCKYLLDPGMKPHKVWVSNAKTRKNVRLADPVSRGVESSFSSVSLVF